MDLASYKTDRALEANGVWMEIGEGAELLIARVGNPAYKVHARKLYRPYQHLIDENKLPPEISDRLVVESMVPHVLKGWRGLTEDGVDVGEYTEARAKDILTRLPDFREFVWNLAKSAELFRAERVAEAGKGSKKS